MVLAIKEGLVECATVCVKSVVILKSKSALLATTNTQLLGCWLLGEQITVLISDLYTHNSDAQCAKVGIMGLYRFLLK